jgi:hypothetical protein
VALTAAQRIPRARQPQVEVLKHRFGANRVLLVGDRGMITSVRITEKHRPELDHLAPCIQPWRTRHCGPDASNGPDEPQSQ